MHTNFVGNEGKVRGGGVGGPRPGWWIILKWILNEQNARTWTGLVRLRMEANGRMM